MKKIMSLLLVVGLVGLFSVKAFADIRSASVLYTAGKYTEAMADFNDTASKDTDQSQQGLCFFYVGKCYFELGNYSSARTALDLVLALTKNGASQKTEAQWLKGRCFEVEENYTEAIKEYGKIINIKGGSADGKAVARIYMAVCYEALNDEVNVQEQYKQILVLKNCSPNVLMSALNKIDFNLMEQSTADTLLISAYRAVIDKHAKDKDGNYIYLNYLSVLIANMSQKAQVNFVK